ncbi:hypothetical protein SAMN05216184_104130 [Georgenia satyanarayanai]|uniref:Uncharacterized protein n=1 Tax=Georgenia satyanarayanai TaxID=860221 RepID=A0A2Y9A7J7_9MICO|nr:hypothetical protein [Georgenia satyanarayanai]PYG00191.1 hypothetical protein A8987_104130 [Georgenia satyanarayanai]SSA40431.1 hypothetical protein SAMN05216184_104130 [Georgenia satyanarayanai]
MSVTYELEATWPITDVHHTSLDDLKAQALADLRATLAAEQLTAIGNVLWGVTHGARPEVTARLLVTGDAGRTALRMALIEAPTPTKETTAA